MVYQQMVHPDDLTDFPGAPFPETVVRIAEASIRAEAGWHIAPVITETITVDAVGGTYLRLPSLRVVSVDEITDVTKNATLADWTSSASGTLHRRTGWPWGHGSVSVTFTHGFDEMPPELLLLVAARCQLGMVSAGVTQRSETVGPFTRSESFNPGKADAGDPAASALARYRLPPRFA